MSEAPAVAEARSSNAADSVVRPDASRLRASGPAEPGVPTPVDELGEPSAMLRTAMISERELEDGSARAAISAEVLRRHPGSDTEAIERAFDLGMKAHTGQRRKSGEAYYVHPVRVSWMLAQLGLDAATVTAGLLHDVVEDTEHTVYELTELFGREVANIVDGVTKLGKVPYLSRQEQQAESFRKMLVAMSQDIRVLLVKLIDRLDNMRTLEHMPRDKQERISRETMQIYAPLAGRLGIEVVQRELQDLSFSYLEPAAFAATKADIAAVLEDRAMIDEGLASLRAAFDNSACELEDGDVTAWPPELGAVEVRASLRAAYRVQQSLAAQGRGLDQLSDVVTYQIVTADRGGCYAALGQLHAHFQPVPGRFRDYIALPRPNHYRALHTSVIDRLGNRLEVQIRSKRMDAVAERGIVAEFELDHALGNEARRLAWLRQLMDWQQDVSDPGEFIEAVKADLFADEVYVFTPGGDIQTFPKGSTPIDFAFAIHTDVGMHCTGARVNGQLVPLRYRLRQGDTVEILTNDAVEPRDEWLKMCVSSRARAKIKQFLRQRERKRLRALGRSLLEQELESRGVPLKPLEDAGALAEQAEAMGLPRETVDDGMYEAIGAGQIAPAALADKLAPSPSAPSPGGEESGLFVRMLRRMTARPKTAGGETLGAKPTAPIVVTRERVEGRGGSRGMIQLAPCCSPVPGDPLIGFFEAGKGIVAHVQGCPEALEQIGERRVHLAWEPNLALDCPVTLEVRTANTLGLLAEMSRAFSHHGVNIKQANCRAIGDGERAINTFYATVHSLDQLESLVATLKRTEGVGAVERVFSQGSGMYPRS